MKQLLLATTVLLGMTAASCAAVIEDFGLDPTSASGQFSHTLGTSTSTFDDQYTFTLDKALTLTIASVTNVFAGPKDKITNFTGGVFEGIPSMPGTEVIGPVMAQLGCQPVPTHCQGFAGTAILAAGSYFLDISGKANGSSGYGGDLATFAAVTPLPGALALFATGIFGVGGALLRRRRKEIC